MMSDSDTYADQLWRMDPEIRRAIAVMAENAGFPPSIDPEQQRFCEALAIAARLGEISLRSQAQRPT